MSFAARGAPDDSTFGSPAVISTSSSMRTPILHTGDSGPHRFLLRRRELLEDVAADDVVLPHVDPVRS